MSNFLTTETLFKNYYKRLCHFAWQLIGDNILVEDLVQDAFISYWKNKHALAEHPDVIRNYLYTTVRHACYNVIRRKKVEERYSQLTSFEDWEDEKILSKILRAEVLNELENAVNTLPESCQKICRLGCLEGLSNLKVAESLGLSVNTIKTQKQRGIKLLRNRLNPELFILILIYCESV